MNLAIDAMGGDFAPKEIVFGVVEFCRLHGNSNLIDEIYLVGDEKSILSCLESNELPKKVRIINTPEYVLMDEQPTVALRKKKNASIALAARLVKEHKASAFISAGSTGAQLAASLLEIGKISGIERPPISVFLPTTSENGVLICDVGANVDCRPLHLLQFAVMGSIYYEEICKIKMPKVGLLNVGAEAGKGNELTKLAFELLKKAPINFIGNIEPDHMFAGEAHVVVCDGFVGNILLKTSEGVAEMILQSIHAWLKNSNISQQNYIDLLQILKKFQPDAPEYSGAPLLGIDGAVIVCHGKSKARVIAQAIRLAANYAKSNVISIIKERIESLNLSEVVKH